VSYPNDSFEHGSLEERLAGRRNNARLLLFLLEDLIAPFFSRLSDSAIVLEIFSPYGLLWRLYSVFFPPHPIFSGAFETQECVKVFFCVFFSPLSFIAGPLFI